MTNRSLKAIAAAALISVAALTLPSPADAGHGGWGAGLVGFGIGAIVGSALAPREVYVVPPPPPARAPITDLRLTARRPGARAGTPIAATCTARTSILRPATSKAPMAAGISAANRFG
jgi:hypothetical protein